MSKPKRNVTERPQLVSKVITDKLGGHWVKATVVYKQLYHLAAGLPLAMKLQQEEMGQMLYFARYTTPPYRLEIQLCTKHSMAELRKFILGYSVDNVKPIAVKFEACQGSIPHALAFSIVGALKLSGTLNMDMLRDVFHWTYNMAGFSYLQEAVSSTVQTWAALRGIPGWTNEPAFGPRRKNANTTSTTPTKARRHARK